MVSINKQRMVPVIEEPFVVFLVGMRINKFWKVHKWLPLYLKMSKIAKELSNMPDIGFMGHESWMGNPRLIIQYWRSYDELQAYARSKDATHFPTWVSFNETIGRSADIGIWHEVYVIEPGHCEAVYTHMPAFGLGKATRLDSNATLRIRKKRIVKEKDDDSSED